MKKRFLLGTIILSLAMLFISCYTPSPLYGTWSDGNNGNKIIFFPDGTFSADLKYNSETYEYSGTYDTIDNVIIFTITNTTDPSASLGTLPREWSISGAIMKLHKFRDDESAASDLTLYHYSR